MLFIFDWDGTLIDSAERIVQAMQTAADDCRFAVRDAAEVRNIIGLGLPEAIAALYPDLAPGQLADLQQAYAQRYVAADQQPCELFPGVLDTLQELKARGGRLAIATGKSRRGLQRVLTQLDLLGFFHASRCADETRSKPHPQMLHELLIEFDRPAGQAVMIGDTEYDMAMARNAAMPRIAVDYGAHAAERLRPYAPELIMSDFRQLLAWRSGSDTSH